MSHDRRVSRFVTSTVALSILATWSLSCDDVACPFGTVRVGDRCMPTPPAETAGDMAVTASGAAGVNGASAGTTSLSSTDSASAPNASAGTGTGSAAPGAGAAGFSAAAGAPGSMGNQPQVGSIGSTAGASAAGAGGAAVGSAGAAASPGPEPCSEPNAMRCVADGSGGREMCTGGVWTAVSSCRPDEICAGPDTNEPGSCLMKAAVCAGSAGKSTCDGSGTLYRCDQNGVIEMQQPCGSLDLCKPGLMTGVCAMCVPGSSRCMGAQLEKCSSSGDSFGSPMSCATAELCDEKGGTCRPAACKPDEFTCRGDTLYKCNAQQTDFQMVQSCGAGMCNASKRACNACSPGEMRCSGNSLLKCSVDGSMQTTMVCPKFCSNNACVDCRDGDTEPCGSGCARGVRTCVRGSFGACAEGSNPDKSTETCNGRDDDCDDVPDNCKIPNLTIGSMCVQGTCLPSGSYLDTCTGCNVFGNRLSCRCKEKDGVTLVPAECTLSSAVKGIWQGVDETHPNGGALICGT